MDLSGLAQQTAGLIDQLSVLHGEDTEIRLAMILVEVDRGNGKTELIVESSDDRPWCQLAFMDEHRFQIEGRRDELAESELEDD